MDLCLKLCLNLSVFTIYTQLPVSPADSESRDQNKSAEWLRQISCCPLTEKFRAVYKRKENPEFCENL